MIRVFIDASVLFAAAKSATGASREIIRLAIRGEMRLVVSQFVLKEARRNLQAKAPEVVGDFDHLLDAASLEIVRPSKKEVQAAMAYTATKDAPIVAAAKKAQVDYLVSLDRRHLVGVPELPQRSGLKIILPEELLKEVRKHVEEEGTSHHQGQKLS